MKSYELYDQSGGKCIFLFLQIHASCYILSKMKCTIVDLFVIFFDKMEKNSWGFPGQIVASLAITTLYLDVPTIRLVVIVSGL